MHRVAEDGLEESANGSVATGQMRRSSVMATTLALTKHAFSWKTDHVWSLSFREDQQEALRSAYDRILDSDPAHPLTAPSRSTESICLRMNRYASRVGRVA